MKLLITSATQPLPARLASDLAASHEVVTTDRKADPGAPGLVVCDLGHDSATDDLVRGVDAIVHWGGTDPDASASDRLDEAAYRTYNLLRAATDAGVPRAVYLGSLGVMDRYPEEYTVTERWRPEPTTSLDDLSFHLGEYVCREFAREGKLQVVCLRLGSILWNTEHPCSDGVTAQDAVEAVGRSLTAELPGYSVFHVQSQIPGQRYGTERAQRILGFKSTWRPA